MNEEIIVILAQQRAALAAREDNSAADREAIYQLDRAIELLQGADAKRAQAKQ